MPKMFVVLLKEFGDCSETVLESHLVQSNFKPERAKQVAKAFVANKAFAKLDLGSRVDVPEYEVDDVTPITAAVSASTTPTPNPAIKTPTPLNLEPRTDVLAQYTIPLGANQATLVFTGQQLTADDFDALSDFVEFSKKQFIRGSKKAAPAKPDEDHDLLK